MKRHFNFHLLFFSLSRALWMWVDDGYLDGISILG